jgi:hypothetical protein
VLGCRARYWWDFRTLPSIRHMIAVGRPSAIPANSGRSQVRHPAEGLQHYDLAIVAALLAALILWVGTGATPAIGKRAKTVLTDSREVAIEVPRDRDGMLRAGDRGYLIDARQPPLPLSPAEPSPGAGKSRSRKTMYQQRRFCF